MNKLKRNKLCFFRFKRVSFNVLLLCCLGTTASAAGGLVEKKLENKTPLVEVAVQEESRWLTGKVVDEDGESLPGATVRIDKSTRGVSTDFDGSFGLNVKNTDKLLISFVGYEDQLVEVGKNKVLIVKLLLKSEYLDEAVAVAFGTQKKESIVASIETLDPEALRAPSSNLTNAFAGRIAGLISYQRSGEPGDDNAEFFVRGVTTFGYASAPLILLDGFEISSDDLARVQPDNIAQFAVLKDATAAALYGSKGANGVIMVTTKQGKEGPIRVFFRHESRFSRPTEILKTVDGIDYMNLYNQAQYNDNPLTTPYYSAQKIQNTIDNVNPYAYPNTNWYDEMFESSTYNQSYVLNVNGGGKVARYYLGVTLGKETGILKNNDFNNFKNNIDITDINVLAKININITPTTTFEVNMNSVFRNSTGPVVSASDIFKNVMNGNPVEFPIYYPNTGIYENNPHTMFGTDYSGKMANPYADMVKGFSDATDSRILSQFSLKQDLAAFTEGLGFIAKVSIGTNSNTSNSRSFKPFKYSLQQYDALEDQFYLSAFNLSEGTEVLGAPAESKSSSSKLYIETGFTYNRNFNEMHDVGAVVIYTQEENKVAIPLADGEVLSVAHSLPSRNQGIRGRVNYAFNKRYLAEFSLTYNGSEKFDKEYRYGLFPAMGVGYMLSEENYWEPLKAIFPTFKLKYSLGQVGNDNIARPQDRFFFLSDVAYTGGYQWGTNFATSYGGYTVNRYANSEIQWEIAIKQNAGIEFNLLDMFTITAEYFYEQRKSIYQKREHLPSTMGLTADMYGNVGEVVSEGFDGTLVFNHAFNSDVWLSARATFTLAKNKVIQNEEPDYRYDYLSREGHPVNQDWGYIAERLFIDDQDVANSPTQELGGSIQAGDIKYRDINNDGRINTDDQVPIGFPNSPELNYGFGFSAGYKGFDLSCFFQGQGRVSFFVDPATITPFVNQRNALQFIADDHWSPDNPVSQAYWPRLSIANNPNNFVKNSTWWQESGNIIRLKTLEFGYTLPKRWMEDNFIEELRFYVSGSNLFKISSFDMWDTEMGANGLGYPLQQVYSLGVNINF